MLALVENSRRKQLNWVNAILEHKKWRPSRLAKEASVDHSTLSKFLNDTNNTAQLNSYTIEKLEVAGGIPAYETKPIDPPAGLGECEAETYDPSTGAGTIPMAVRALISNRNGIDAWVLHSNALELEGYVAGDILIVDLNATPLTGDIVCVQVYDRIGRAETVFRLYEAPYLVSATTNRALRRPVLLDNERAVIRGVVINSMRDRRAVA